MNPPLPFVYIADMTYANQHLPPGKPLPRQKCCACDPCCFSCVKVIAIIALVCAVILSIVTGICAGVHLPNTPGKGTVTQIPLDRHYYRLHIPWHLHDDWHWDKRLLHAHAWGLPP